MKSILSSLKKISNYLYKLERKHLKRNQKSFADKQNMVRTGQYGKVQMFGARYSNTFNRKTNKTRNSFAASIKRNIR